MEIRHILTSAILLLQQFVFLAISAILLSDAYLALPFYPAAICATIYHYSLTEATSPTVTQRPSLGSATIYIASKKLCAILL